MASSDASTAPGRVSSVWSDPSADVLVIGGGINGIATFRELALQGVKVVLVEKNDYCSGASAASSHMIHGGIRYLENGEIRLVRESLLERNRLLSNAPHYVKPLRTTIPIFSTFSGLLSAPLKLFFQKGGAPKERGALLIKIGLMLYDTFGRYNGRLPRHEFLGKKKTLATLPHVNHDVKYSAHYYDAAIESPERLAMDLLRDSLATGTHARAANYVEAAGMSGDGVLLRDTVTGDTVTFRAPVVLNASGPWVDKTNSSLGTPSRFMGGTKGSHIVLDNPELFAACDGREIFFENKDGRIVLMYPLLGRVLLGTTDIPISDPDDAVCTEEEVDYFFDLASHVFPNITLERSQIVYRYSGVRPLPAAGDINPGVISRDYRIVKEELGAGSHLWSLIGGKWTTFRALGEHWANEVLDHLGVRRSVSTEQLAIGGGVDFPQTPAAIQDWISQHKGSLSSERAEQLLNRYGTFAEAIIEDLEALGDEPLQHAPQYSRGEIISLVQREQVVTLSDLTHRRTDLAFVGALSTQCAQEIGLIISEIKGWGQSEMKSQLESIPLERSVRNGA
jgi:glycerol-3-phosphate dehydrogenase